MLGNGDHHKERIKEKGDNFRSVYFFKYRNIYDKRIKHCDGVYYTRVNRATIKLEGVERN